MAQQQDIEFHSEVVFYIPGQPTIIDLTYTDPDGVVRSQCYRESLEQIRQRFPGAALGTLGHAMAEGETSLQSDPAEITEDQYSHMLEVLPPLNWRHGDGSESFMLCELIYGNTTSIYCRIGACYFTFNDSASLSHEQIVSRCKS